MPLFNASLLTGSQQGNFAIIQTGGLGDESGTAINSGRYNPFNGSSSPLRLTGSDDTGDSAILYDPQGLITTLGVNDSQSNTPGYSYVNSLYWQLKTAGDYRFTLIKQYSSYSNGSTTKIDGVGLISSISSVPAGASSWQFETVKLVLWETYTDNPSSGDPVPLTPLEASNTVTITNDRFLFMVMRKEYLSYGGVYALGTARIKIEKL